jgi:hypothetical protein
VLIFWSLACQHTGREDVSLAQKNSDPKTKNDGAYNPGGVFKQLSTNTYILAAAIIFVFLAFAVIRPQGSLAVALDDVSIGISCGDRSAVQVYFRDIRAVHKVSSLDPGRMVSGYEDESVRCGTFENDTYGIFQFFQNKSVDVFIVLQLADSSLVFTCDSKAQTNQIYADLLSRLGSLPEPSL